MRDEGHVVLTTDGVAEARGAAQQSPAPAPTPEGCHTSVTNPTHATHRQNTCTRNSGRSCETWERT